MRVLCVYARGVCSARVISRVQHTMTAVLGDVVVVQLRATTSFLLRNAMA